MSSGDLSRPSGATEFLRKQTRVALRGPLALTVALSLSTLLVAGTAAATELRDAELVASGAPVLENGAGTVRIEYSRLGRIGPPVFFVPEPGALWQQMGAGIGLLALLAGRRRLRLPTAAPTPGRAHAATTKRTMS